MRIAWDRVPKAKQIEDGQVKTLLYECTVRMNLALALEKQGDAAMSTDRARCWYKEDGLAPCQSAASMQNQQNQNPARAAVAAPMLARLMIALSKSSLAGSKPGKSGQRQS